MRKLKNNEQYRPNWTRVISRKTVRFIAASRLGFDISVFPTEIWFHQKLFYDKLLEVGKYIEKYVFIPIMTASIVNCSFQISL